MAYGDHQDRHAQIRRPSRRDLERTESTLRSAVDAMDEDHMPATATFSKRLCNNDCGRFTKYIESTTTHGLVRVFTGKSKVRRLFWAFVFLAAAGVCLFNIINRIIYFAGDPTSTTVSQKSNRDGIIFPAVTICNLNQVKRSVVESLVDETELFALTQLFSNPSQVCENITTLGDYLKSVIPGNLSYRLIQDVARHRVEDMITRCSYAGEECSHTNFSEVLTHLGYCYTFNGKTAPDRSVLKSKGIGTRYGLSLTLNIEQDEYFLPLRADAGVKISIHSQDQPPAPDDIGVAAPPGRNMYIGIRQRNVSDASTSSRKAGSCREVDDKRGFNFLQDDFEYSTLACLVDCFFSNITEECGCIETSINTPPPSSRFRGYPDCSSVDLCCVGYYYSKAHPCDCPSACKYIAYDITTSYSAFSAPPLAEQLALIYNVSTEYLSNNILQLNVYYESQDTVVEMTVNAYSPTALLSDIGGLLGLFIGASVISILEFGTWLLDELKDRCFGLNGRKLGEWYKTTHTELEALDKIVKQETNAESAFDWSNETKNTSNNNIDINDTGTSEQ